MDNKHNQDTNDNIEVWEDLVQIKDLVMALVICSITTMGAYFIAPNEAPKPLFFGLAGALIGFIICSFIIKPKRNFKGTGDK
ncbi:hypothetical protein [Niallia sp. FSL W8-0635]|uniref:hypothetical protein n=1 Tax=Niallia sp. FSL W8-0635 TaxID=2975337 RepID=UPI0009C9A2F0|nr:Uncharacterised protein [Mycobacteroides abscessus subsp. abscessus]